MKKVAVIGAGVIGLTCADVLSEQGFDVRVLAREAGVGTTSAVAGAIWWLFHVSPMERTKPWSMVSLERFRHLANHDPESGVLLRTGTHRIRHEVANEDRWWEVTGDFRTVSKQPDLEVVELRLPIVDMPVYLSWLQDRLEKRSVEVEIADLGSLDEVSADVIVNCSGLGARELAGDPSVEGLRGQVVEVRCPGINEFSVDEDGPGGLAHVFPRINSVVLGGVTEESESVVPDPGTTRAILDRCQRLDPRLDGATVLRSSAGLRPARPDVRLEVDGATTTPVIHNYGHGGGGVTLSWGCANEVLELCEQLSCSGRSHLSG